VNPIPPGWLIGGGVVAAGSLLAVLAMMVARRRRTLEHLLRRIAWKQLTDVVIPDDVDGEIHLDLVLLTARGILVLDIRRASGTLYWGDQLERWTVLDGARRKVIDNPLPGMHARRHAVEALVDGVPVEGRVLLVGPIQVSGGMPPGAVQPEGLVIEYPAHDRGPPPPALRAAWDTLAAAARAV
jgi:hypothetical protein